MVLKKKKQNFALLSLDCSSDTLSLALRMSGALISQKSLKHDRKLAVLFPKSIEAFLQDQGKTYQDLDGICLNCGPGSFTGLRMGIATALGLGLPLSIPVWGVTGFQSAYGASLTVPSTEIAVILLPDGTTGSYYRQSLNGALEPKGPYPVASYVEERSLLEDPKIFLDDSLTWIIPAGLKASWGDKDQKANGLKTRCLPEDFASAPSIGSAGWYLYTVGRTSDPVPLYVKPCYAEALLGKKPSEC